MVLGLHWISKAVQEWARKLLKWVGREAGREGSHLLLLVVGTLSFQSVFGQPEPHSWGLFVKSHCINANTLYVSALHGSAGRWKAWLLTCPCCSPAAPQSCSSSSSCARRSPSALPRTPGRDPCLQGHSSRVLGPGKALLLHSAFGGAVEEKWRLLVNP